MAVYTVWLALGVVVTLVWLSRHRDVSRACRDGRVLSAGQAPESWEAGPAVSVIVAAKDEERSIERCVRTLLDQDYPNLELIVVNDRSADRTGAILDDLQRASGGRLRVMTIETLPDGWYGKTHAVHQAAAVARGSLLLFTDADCWQLSDRSVSAAVRYALDNDIELLSLLPHVEMSCAWESLIQPVCTAVLMVWHSPERVNDASSRTAYANGAFMLLRREALDRIGGHQSVRGILCEDMAIARRAKAAGVRLHVIRTRDLYATRMYGTLGETWRGWSRIFRGALVSATRIVGAMALLLVFSIGPWASLMGAGVVAWASDADAFGVWRWPLLIWGAAAAAQQSVTLRLYPLLGGPRWRAISYFLGALISLGILTDALFRVLGIGSTTWQGTSYQAGGVPAPADRCSDESPAHVG